MLLVLSNIGAVSLEADIYCKIKLSQRKLEKIIIDILVNVALLTWVSVIKEIKKNIQRHVAKEFAHYMSTSKECTIYFKDRALRRVNLEIPTKSL
jgi:hypothetical protein